jgi:hypothetical protein
LLVSYKTKRLSENGKTKKFECQKKKKKKKNIFENRIGEYGLPLPRYSGVVWYLPKNGGTHRSYLLYGAHTDGSFGESSMGHE